MIWPAPDKLEGRSSSAGPLSGLRILDFSQWLPGPFCTQIFSDLGADVVKVEPPAGDPGRLGNGYIFDVANRNKRSVVLDLKNADDLCKALDLATVADIVLEGFRPGVADRLGIGYEAIRALRPQTIYCSISGYGQTGPSRNKPGHDLSYLAVTGGFSFSPHWTAGSPRRSGIPVADLSASFYAAIAILAALRERDRSGTGSYLDVAIADAAFVVASPRAGVSFRHRPEDRIGIFPNNDCYRAADGHYVAVSAVEPHFWGRLRKALIPFAAALADPRFDTNASRHANGAELCDLLSAAFAQKTADDWVAMFAALDVPVDKVVGIAEAAASPQIVARGIVGSCDGVSLPVFPVIRNGAVMGRFDTKPPRLGQHGAELFLSKSKDAPTG